MEDEHRKLLHPKLAGEMLRLQTRWLLALVVVLSSGLKSAPAQPAGRQAASFSPAGQTVHMAGTLTVTGTLLTTADQMVNPES